MPYFKCVPCKIRVSTAGAGTDLATGACPGCGVLLEPVAELTEVLGFRSPDVFDPTVAPRVAEQVVDISGGRAAAQAQIETDRWLSEGGSLGLEMLAAAVALPKPTGRP
ncbi:MAG: hypothetical protein H0T69_00170 [Thermoleophilaceae bacterium]|nr:hypothetical protein [Thermoleophilaceae bacterium]